MGLARTRENFAQIRLYAMLLLPISGIAQRNLFKTHSIVIGGGAYVEMARNDHGDWKTYVPVFCATCAAPDRKTWNTP
jgi:hypothetical protein